MNTLTETTSGLTSPSRIHPPTSTGVLERITQKMQETLNRAAFVNGELDRICGSVPSEPSPEPNGNSAVDILEFTIDRLWVEINAAANRVQAL